MNKIFVVGRNRSGTKWISNLLSNHPDVVSVQREGAGGILETNIFYNYPEWFDLSDKEEQSAFEILFKHSNFYKCADLKEESIDFDKHDDFYFFFDEFMSCYAKQNSANTYLQKTSVQAMPQLKKYFPDARFVVIQRGTVYENVISNILLGDSHIKNSKIIQTVFSYWMHRKSENQFSNENNVVYIKFEDLKRDTKGVLKEVCPRLGLDYKPGMEVSPFKPNTSFKDGNDSSHYYTRSIKIRIKIVSRITSALPLEVIVMLRRLFRRTTKPSLIPKSFSIYRQNKYLF